jgi:flagellin
MASVGFGPAFAGAHPIRFAIGTGETLMAFTINTNIASLQSQEYLRINTEFQQKTINRVTSGLRIVSSGDDAAGLAIANGFRSDRSVLTQGVRNANDGLSTLQTIDGGINNISQLLDRARTLATQSASGTFTGDRAVLNSEFQNVISEIDRQAKLIGLDAKGIFATKLSVFIGGGRGVTTADQIANGKISVDLSTSNIDSKGLGLSGQRVSGALVTDVSGILADATNTGSAEVPGWTEFYLRGPGFSDSERVRVSVNLNGVDNAEKLVIAINSAIDQAGSGGTDVSEAFRNAGVRAKLVTDEKNNTRLIFESSNSAFQIAAGDRLANALLGNHESTVGDALDYSITGGQAAASTGTAFSVERNVVVRVHGGSLAEPVDLTLNVSTSTTVDDALTSLTSAVANNSSLMAAGISVATASAGSKIAFTSKRGENFEVLAVNDVSNVLGLGTAQNGVSTSVTGFDVTSVTSAAVGTGSGAGVLAFSVGGGDYITVSHTFDASTSNTEIAGTLNNAFSTNATLQRAGLVASTSAGGAIQISSNNGSFFRVNSQTSGANFGFGTVAGSASEASVTTTSFTTTATVNSGGAYATSLLAYDPIRSGDDDQVITVSLKDVSGNDQAVAITLQSDGAEPRGRTIDEALHYINEKLQEHPSEEVRRVVAVKERDPDDGTEKIRFLSPGTAMKVSIGVTPGGAGISSDQGSVVTTEKLDGGADIDIANLVNAEAAVTALAQAVTKLGAVQAVVGRGQNQLNFAISIAQTQIINLNASESRIRDADLAAEAANLSKAQVLQQAGIAALAQANATPQAVLSLLQG